jgi:hypothetical protein
VAKGSLVSMQVDNYSRGSKYLARSVNTCKVLLSLYFMISSGMSVIVLQKDKKIVSPFRAKFLNLQPHRPEHCPLAEAFADAVERLGETSPISFDEVLR